MRNWSIDTTELQKDPIAYKKWQVEQLLTYGLDEGDFLERSYLEKNIDKLDIPIDMVRFVKFLLADA